MAIIESLINKPDLTKDYIISILSVNDPEELELLYKKADRIRRERKGNDVHIRGIIEFSNYCARWCHYCGLSMNNKAIERYRMSPEEILESARRANTLKYKTVVLQSGEDNHYTKDMLVEIIRAIKRELGLIITLSIGERADEEYRAFREAGADRYLIKHETSNPALYQKLHPDMSFENRLHSLRYLKSLGFEVGSGIMVGLPGQSYEDLATDILLFKELQVDMVGLGPYINHPEMPLSEDWDKLGYLTFGKDFDIETLVYKVLALTRIVNPDANIPATTSLATINNATGRESALNRGANVVMPNVTALEFRKMYEIYPSKVCIDEKPEQCSGCIRNRIKSIGRVPV